MKLNKYWESFCFYVLLVPTTLKKKVFSHCNSNDNYVYLSEDLNAFQRAVNVFTIVRCRRRRPIIA